MIFHDFGFTRGHVFKEYMIEEFFYCCTIYNSLLFIIISILIYENWIKYFKNCMVIN